ncbi:hypothetical protein [Roseitranquillus sediminis]|uniref:hypothetical protein n=1 Tax=Roseitranquillus sediminis TaxID=2809051 RepID=UPI001D0C941D|nr:hypothetical protein [Roseitranquillus sediminis]MBM9596001.1 hypothetical protein [Roseitranquillus sediminis]
MNARDEEQDLALARQEGREALSPWLGWIFGPVAWALHQGIGYTLVPLLCEMGSWPYHVLTAFALALCAAGGWAAMRALRRSRHVRPERSAERLKMMALVGFMLCASALGGIVVEYGSSFLIDVCAGIA